jgi:hypothetical protein
MRDRRAHRNRDLRWVFLITRTRRAPAESSDLLPRHLTNGTAISRDR